MDSTTTMTPADFSAMMGNNRDGQWGCGGAWWIIILFLFLMGGNGWGNANGYTAATTADIQRAVDLNSIKEGQASLGAEIQRGIYEINANTQHNAYDNLGEIRDVQAATTNGFYNTQAQINTGFAAVQNTLTSGFDAMQSCCCQTNRNIDGVNYNLATQSAAIQATSTANTQKILDALSNNRMAEMQNEINALQLQNAVAGVVRYPMASTYSSGANPFCSCGCGCQGNV